MRKLTFLLAGCLFFATMGANAQTEFRPFRVDLGAGFAIPSNGFGALFNVEPKYAVIPQLSVGLKLEWAALWRDLIAGEAGGNATLQWMGTYLATADYHLMLSAFRPFVGAGLGLFNIGAASATVNEGGADAGLGSTSNFGAMIRAGFDVRHFRLALAYNFAGNDALGNSAGFLSITAGAYIGGGIRR